MSESFGLCQGMFEVEDTQRHGLAFLLGLGLASCKKGCPALRTEGVDLGFVWHLQAGVSEEKHQAAEARSERPSSSVGFRRKDLAWQ